MRRPPYEAAMRTSGALVFCLAFISASGCAGRSKTHLKALDTIEAAESYAKAHGIALEQKTENKQQIVARRAFDYAVSGSKVRVGILELPSADTVKNLDQPRHLVGHLDERGLGISPDTDRPWWLVRMDPIVFTVTGGGEAARNEIVGALVD